MSHDFECLVDKTKFIEVLEKESGTLYPFIVRPHRFGKTLFTSVLQAYYDRSFGLMMLSAGRHCESKI